MQDTSKPTKRAAERIRETAEELFYREGIRAVGVDEIVSRAGVTKPSLYRTYPSKDELAADYLRHHGAERLKAFDALFADGKDARASLRKWLFGIQTRASTPEYRGCGNSNAVVEYPHPDHPARQAALEVKRQFRERYRNVAKKLGAKNPAMLADMLILLIEGAHLSGQLFGAEAPARHLVAAADALIDAHIPHPQKAKGA
ncbi:AcrR family transcriptional regulator [Rhizomicrobium palustre]|uniref:AcrR family transcriptional regulator n=1 Tax=Rhizomicrobium palustre TaxID=189966 RepID=A0A846N1C9_9PROT|nr:AcrR family transcriptional regulator [Rhizomicrobium palustre]